MADVVVTDEFAAWYESLDDSDADAVTVAVSRLELLGVVLGYPHSSAIKGAAFALRELRIQSRGRPLRALYAFDPERNAVMLLGGDKGSDSRFYETMVAKAEKLWGEYLAEHRRNNTR